MATTPARPHRSAPPARSLRLLANLAPGVSVIFGLIAVWLVVATIQSLAQPVSPMIVISLVLGMLTAVVAALTSYRLGVEVPRILRGWEGAL